MGRPPLPEEERRNDQLHVRCRKAERIEIEGAAELDGVKASDWIVSQLLAAAKRTCRRHRKGAGTGDEQGDRD